MTARKKGIATDLKKLDEHAIRPGEYDDAPELTDEQLARTEIHEGGKPVRPGRPPIDRPKVAIKLRLSPAVVDHFRAGGPGWQTRINETLERAVKRQKRAGRS